MFLDAELLDEVAVDLDYLTNRWGTMAYSDRMSRLLKVIRAADKVVFAISESNDNQDIRDTCTQFGIPLQEAHSAVQVCGSVLKDEGLVVSGDIRLFSLLVHGGTIFKPTYRNGPWEVYRADDWERQFKVEPERWGRFVDLFQQGISPHQARKMCKKGNSPSLTLIPAQSHSISPETKGLILEIDQLSRENWA